VRTYVLVIMAACLAATAALAQTMKPTAPQKMMSPEEQKKLNACQQQAADQNIRMDERAKFVMDCMTKKQRSPV
jgi:ABC-type transporter MlaC component